MNDKRFGKLEVSSKFLESETRGNILSANACTNAWSKRTGLSKWCKLLTFNSKKTSLWEKLSKRIGEDSVYTNWLRKKQKSWWRKSMLNRPVTKTNFTVLLFHWNILLATTLPWLKKNAFLARILQDFLSRSCKIMHFSARHLARILQGINFLVRFLQGILFPWKILARNTVSLKDSCKEKKFVGRFLQGIVFPWKILARKKIHWKINWVVKTYLRY